MFKDVGDVEVVDELEGLGKVEQHGLTLVLSHGLEPYGVTTSGVHQGVNTLAQDLTKLGERERERR